MSISIQNEFVISEPCHHSLTMLNKCQAKNKKIFALYSALSEKIHSFLDVNISKEFSLFFHPSFFHDPELIFNVLSQTVVVSLQSQELKSL
jgi:hypothetical protein